MRSKLTKIIQKTAVITVLLGGLVAMGGTITTARAYDGCNRRIDRQEDKLQRDIARHGFHSWQADRDRRELADLRYRCGPG